MFCKNCGKSNDDTFKFCQYCGERLEAEEESAERTQAELPESTISTPTSLDAWLIDDDESLDSLTESLSIGNEETISSEADEPLPGGDDPTYVEGKCVTPDDAPADPIDEALSKPQAQRCCHHCGAYVEPGHRFCGACGTRFEDESMPSGEISNSKCTVARPSFIMKRNISPQGTHANFMLNNIYDDGTVGDSIELFEGENIIGRLTNPLLSKDRFVNPKHLRITCKGDLAAVEDYNSLNGVFIRISNTSITLADGDIFRIGEELLSYHHGDSNQVLLANPGSEKTALLGGPETPGWGYIRLILGAYAEGDVYRLTEPTVTIGRTHADILFPRDGFVSGKHASLQNNGNTALLTDLGSSNGTFVRIKSPVHITGTTHILIGNKLLRLTRR